MSSDETNMFWGMLTLRSEEQLNETAIRRALLDQPAEAAFLLGWDDRAADFVATLRTEGWVSRIVFSNTDADVLPGTLDREDRVRQAFLRHRVSPRDVWVAPQAQNLEGMLEACMETFLQMNLPLRVVLVTSVPYKLLRAYALARNRFPDMESFPLAPSCTVPDCFPGLSAQEIRERLQGEVSNQIGTLLLQGKIEAAYIPSFLRMFTDRTRSPQGRGSLCGV